MKQLFMFICAASDCQCAVNESRYAAECTHQLRKLVAFDDRDAQELDVQVLVHGVERAHERDVVLELHGDLFAHERLEERVEQLQAWQSHTHNVT